MVSVGVFLPRRSSALPEWHKNWLFRMRPMISASLIRSHTMPDVVGVSVEYWGVSMHAFFRIEACFFFHATALVGEVRHYSTVRIQWNPRERCYIHSWVAISLVSTFREDGQVVVREQSYNIFGRVVRVFTWRTWFVGFYYWLKKSRLTHDIPFYQCRLPKLIGLWWSLLS